MKTETLFVMLPQRGRDVKSIFYSAGRLKDAYAIGILSQRDSFGAGQHDILNAFVFINSTILFTFISVETK